MSDGVYDGDNWGNFCGSVNKTFLPVQYAPSRTHNRTDADLVDASIGVKTVGKDMVTSYTFALDMTQLEVPEQLKDLTYMLPGADQEGASAWTFLLQLAERISTLTEVKATITFDDRFDVDYSALSVLNEYFELKNTEFDKETNTLTLTLNWINQTAAIDPASGVTYQFNEKGMTKGAWKTTDKGTRYYYGGGYYRAQNPGYIKLIEIDGKTYNFDNDGYITYGVQVLRASTSYEKYVYDFGSDGALVSAITQEGIIKDVNGDWYYVTKDGFVQMDAGLIKIENAYYFVCYSGKLKQNGTRILTEAHVKDYPEITPGEYYFNENCQMILPTVKNGICQEGDIKVYYVNGEKQKNLGLWSYLAWIE